MPKIVTSHGGKSSRDRATCMVSHWGNAHSKKIPDGAKKAHKYISNRENCELLKARFSLESCRVAAAANDAPKA
jgi:hypothetical protein